MIKLIILSLLGKKVVSTRVLFNSIKSYLIFYMLVLPAFMHASVVHEKAGSRAGAAMSVDGSVVQESNQAEVRSVDNGFPNSRCMRVGGHPQTVRLVY